MSTEAVVQNEVIESLPVLREVKDEVKVGDVTGQCKWFNDRYGYGFITVTLGDDKGKDIFVHHSGIKPLNSIYRTLKKGEYVNFSIVTGQHGPQAVLVTGIGGGCLMCDVLPAPRITSPSPPITGPVLQAPSQTPHVMHGRNGFQNAGMYRRALQPRNPRPTPN